MLLSAERAWVDAQSRDVCWGGMELVVMGKGGSASGALAWERGRGRQWERLLRVIPC